MDKRTHMRPEVDMVPQTHTAAKDTAKQYARTRENFHGFQADIDIVATIWRLVTPSASTPAVSVLCANSGLAV